MSEKNLGINWQKIDGLLPVIVTQHDTNDVLMLAYMNQEALNLSLQTGYAHYFSRTKNRIWKKGESSGNTQKIVTAKLDCDSDSLLLSVVQNGEVACHTGAKSCFFKEIELNNCLPRNQTENTVNIKNTDFLDELYHTLIDRKLNADTQNSYTASLFSKGLNQILKKVGEESSELVIACVEAKNSNDKKSDVIYEMADLFFHCFVALIYFDIHPETIISELKRRFGLSGLEEKRQRNAK